MFLAKFSSDLNVPNGRKELRDVFEEYFIIRENGTREQMNQLLSKLANLRRSTQIQHIHDFMEVTQWTQIFPGPDNIDLRNTLRNIQRMYRMHHGTHFGVGDQNTDALSCYRVM